MIECKYCGREIEPSTDANSGLAHKYPFVHVNAPYGRNVHCRNSDDTVSLATAATPMDWRYAWKEFRTVQPVVQIILPVTDEAKLRKMRI